jgi:4a-hydroxytetrahydrobiopterin dehydratase
MPKLDPAARAAFLREFPFWREVPGRDAIARSLQFADFAEAFAFMTRVALLAEKMEHHPEWTNVYAKLDIVLSTHEADGVTEKDIAMARAIEELAKV